MMLWVSPEGRAVRAATEGGWWWIWGGLPRDPRSTHGGTKMGFLGYFYVCAANVVIDIHQIPGKNIH